MKRLRSVGGIRRFRVRWLLALTALASLGAWWWTDQPRRKERAVEAARRLGGVVRHEPDLPTARPADPRPKSDLTSRIEAILPIEATHDLAVVNLDGRAVADADLAALERIKGLKTLYIYQ